MKLKILITGSRGFVGQSVGRHMLACGHQVLGLSRASQPAAGWSGQHVRADVGSDDISGLVREFKADIVVHAAGSASVADSIKDPVADFRATAMTFTNVLDGVRRSGIEPVVLQISSAAVYGNPESFPVAEEAVAAPISPYGHHKLFCEMLAKEYAQCYGVTSMVCRVFSLFGPLQRRLLVWELYKQFAGPSSRVELQGTGNETRDFLHVNDLSDALLRLAKVAPQHKATALNLASGVETTTHGLAEEIGTVLGTKKEIFCHGESRPGDPERWYADISKLKSLLGDWHPIKLREALLLTIRDWQSGAWV
jgi:UDP-glucose 4-epimerase